MSDTPITGKTLAAFWETCTTGTRMTCLANTYNLKAPGVTGIVTRPGKTRIHLKQDDGRSFYISPPQRVRDVVSLTEDTITYYIGKGPGHTATWQRNTSA